MRETNMQLQYQDIFLLKWFVVALFDEKKKQTKKPTHTLNRIYLKEQEM